MVSISDFLDLESPTGLSLSPDGKSVVYSTQLRWNHKKGEHHSSALWLADTDREKSAYKITQGTYHDRMPKWSPDGKSIAFVSDRGKRGKAQAIYLLEFGWEEPRALTPPENEEGIPRFEFSPDGNSVAFVTTPAKSKEKKAQEEAGDDMVVWDQDLRRAELRLLDIEKGTIETLVQGEDVHVVTFTWNEEGTEIAYVTHRSPHAESKALHGATISVLTLASKETRKIHNVAGGIRDDIVWTGSVLSTVGWNIPEQSTSGLAVFSVDLASEGNLRIKTDGDETSCALSVFKAGKIAVVYIQKGLEDQLKILNSKVLLSRRRWLLGVDGAETADGDIILVTTEGDVNNPTEVFATRVSDSTTRQLSDHGNAFADKQFGTCNFLACDTLDAKETLDGLYLTPKEHASPSSGKPDKPIPTVVLIHGGPYFRMADTFEADFMHLVIPFLLTEGFGVLIPNYRGSSGRGKRFASYARGGMGVYDEVDVVAMTQAAIQQGFADKDHLLAGGWSQGGYLSYLSSVRNGAHGLGWRFRGLIAGAGVTDWDAMVLTSDIGYWEAEMGGGAMWELDKHNVGTRAGSALWEFKDAAREGRIPPLLMLHGEKDERVPITQAWGFRRALDKAGLPFEFVTYPNEGHLFTGRKHMEDLVTRVVRFVKTHM